MTLWKFPLITKGKSNLLQKRDETFCWGDILFPLTVTKGEIMRILNSIRKHYFRFSLAVQQLISRPYLNLFPLAILVSFYRFWIQKSGFYANAPKLILPLWRGIVQVGGTAPFVILFILTVYWIGALTAKRDECNLRLAFTEQDLRNGCPVLIKKSKDKKTGVTTRVFFSQIPMERWRKCKESIADFMNLHFVKPDLEYGGKNKDKGKLIMMYSKKGRKQPERGVLYDE